MTDDYQKLVEKLDAKIPREDVELRDGGAGRKLSYLPGHYVIDRLNKVFGHGNWSYDSNTTLLHTGTVRDKYEKDVHTVHYSARILLVVKYPNGETASYVDYGYGDGSDKQNVGKAHELAIKESITDGLKRCAKNLGMSFGLALYSKEQENVADAAPVQQAPQTDTITTFKRDDVNRLITAKSRVIVAKKVKTSDELRADMLKKYGKSAKEELTDVEAYALLNDLERQANGN